MKLREIFFGPVVFLIVLGVVLLCHPAEAIEISPLDDPRCCVPVQRNPDGTIKRSDAVRREFQKKYPCPSTKLTTGPCAGYIKDHPVPLACGGVDAVYNMQWLSYDLWLEKSKEERKVYGGRGTSPGCP